MKYGVENIGDGMELLYGAMILGGGVFEKMNVLDNLFTAEVVDSEPLLIATADLRPSKVALSALAEIAKFDLEDIGKPQETKMMIEMVRVLKSMLVISGYNHKELNYAAIDTSMRDQLGRLKSSMSLLLQGHDVQNMDQTMLSNAKKLNSYITQK